ncbi:hypothetical protein BH09ACT6_BH09ACT6_10050 [soil metagenome]
MKLDRATRFSLLAFVGSFVTVAAAVTNAITKNALSTPLLVVMVAGLVFALVMVVSARVERRRVRKAAKPN